MYSSYQAAKTTAHAVSNETIPFRVSAFTKFPIKAAIDRGSSLTKIAFISKHAPTDAEIVQLHCLTFLNADFIAAIKILKENAQLPAEGQLHVTGVGAGTYRKTIREIIGIDIVFIAEIQTIGYGVFLFISNCDPLDIVFPVPDKHPSDIESVVAQESGQCSEQFPAIILYVGSGCAVFLVDKEGKTSTIGSSWLSGKPFMGLANEILETTNYNEIMRLAEIGESRKADLTAQNLSSGDPEFPYSPLEPNMSIIPFAKAANESWDIKSCGREDLAASLVALVTKSLSLCVVAAVNATGVRKIYVSGNFFRHQFLRMQFYDSTNFLMSELEINILKTGHGGAIAAMFLNPEDNVLK